MANIQPKSRLTGHKGHIWGVGNEERFSLNQLVGGSSPLGVTNIWKEIPLKPVHLTGVRVF